MFICPHAPLAGGVLGNLYTILEEFYIHQLHREELNVNILCRPNNFRVLYKAFS